MSLFSVFGLTGSAMSVQSVRLNAVASNMANSEVVAGSEEEAYRARRPVFSMNMGNDNQPAGLQVTGMRESEEPVRKEHMPQHPKADENGFIYHSNVNMVEEMAQMMAASRSFKSNIEVMNTSKQLMTQLINVGR